MLILSKQSSAVVLTIKQTSLTGLSVNVNIYVSNMLGKYFSISNSHVRISDFVNFFLEPCLNVVTNRRGKGGRMQVV